MTLFFSTLFFLVLSDFFVFSFNFIVLFYSLYLFLYFFYSKKTNFLLPNTFFLKKILLNVKILTSFFFSKITSVSLFYSNRLKWKPLFKRSSYFGLYRSTRNQWLNK